MKRALLVTFACVVALVLAWFVSGGGQSGAVSPLADSPEDGAAAHDGGLATMTRADRDGADDASMHDGQSAVEAASDDRAPALSTDARTSLTVTLRCAHAPVDASTHESRLVASNPNDGEVFTEVVATLDQPVEMPLPPDLALVRLQVDDPRYSLGTLTRVREPAGKSIELMLTATGSLVVQGHGRWAHERVAVQANDTGIVNLNVFGGPSHGPYSGDHLDSSGRFTFDALEPGTYRVELVQLDSDDWETTSVTAVVRPGRETRVDVVDPPKNVVALSCVLIANGTPLPNADLILYGVHRGHRIHSRTDEEGRIEAELLLDDEYRIAVSWSGPHSLRASVFRSLDAPVVTSDEPWRLDLGDNVLSGTVFDAAGEPVAEALVRAESLRGGGSFSAKSDSSAEASVQSAQDGSFRFEGLPRGTYLLRVSESSSATSDTTFAAVAQVLELDGEMHATLSASRPRTLTGLVTYDCEEPAAGVNVHLRSTRFDEIPWQPVGETDDDGRFEVHGLEAGTYELYAERPVRLDYNAARLSRVRRVSVDHAEGADITLDLVPGTRLHVTVFDRDGTPLVTELEVFDAAGASIPIPQFPWRDPRRPRTDPLPPDSYELRATLEDGTELRKAVVISGDLESQQVVLTR